MMLPHDQRAPEHEFEAAHGLPEPLPAREKLLWQGGPDAWALARDAMHLRGIALYFGALLAWRGVNRLMNGDSVLDAAAAVLWLLPVALFALGLLGFLGWLTARTTVYTLTDRRIVMRIGIVLSITFNLPYRQVESAGARVRPDGSGDVILLLDDSDRIAYLHLWPHARPWHVKRPQPMLRGLSDARAVAEILASALARATLDTSATPMVARPVAGSAQPGMQPAVASRPAALAA